MQFRMRLSLRGVTLFAVSGSILLSGGIVAYGALQGPPPDPENQNPIDVLQVHRPDIGALSASGLVFSRANGDTVDLRIIRASDVANSICLAVNGATAISCSDAKSIASEGTWTSGPRSDASGSDYIVGIAPSGKSTVSIGVGASTVTTTAGSDGAFLATIPAPKLPTFDKARQMISPGDEITVTYG